MRTNRFPTVIHVGLRLRQQNRYLSNGTCTDHTSLNEHQNSWEYENRKLGCKQLKYNWRPTYSNQGLWLNGIHHNTLRFSDTVNHLKTNLVWKENPYEK